MSKLIKRCLLVVLGFNQEFCSVLLFIFPDIADYCGDLQIEALSITDIFANLVQCELAFPGILERITYDFVDSSDSSSVSTTAIICSFIFIFISLQIFPIPSEYCRGLLPPLRKQPIADGRCTHPIPLSHHPYSPVRNVILPKISKLLLPLLQEFGLISRGPLFILRSFICHSVGGGKYAFKPFETLIKEAKNVPSKCGC